MQVCTLLILMPNVSVIIPTFNRAHLIQESVSSVLSQTFKPKEVIVVDDGSNDKTWDVLKNLGFSLSESRKNTVIPKVPIRDALKKLINKDVILNITRDDFFSTQTPQSFKFNDLLLKEIISSQFLLAIL